MSEVVGLQLTGNPMLQAVALEAFAQSMYEGVSAETSRVATSWAVFVSSAPTSLLIAEDPIPVSIEVTTEAVYPTYTIRNANGGVLGGIGYGELTDTLVFFEWKGDLE